MEGQEMDVDVLSQHELSKINDVMNRNSKHWILLVRALEDEEDVDRWNCLISDDENVFMREP